MKIDARARYIIAGLSLLIGAQVLAPMVWSGRPQPERGEQIAAEVPLPKLLSELQPGEFAGTLLLGGFRGLTADLLWLRALRAKDAGRFFESVALFQLISQVQPRFEQVYEYMGHDMAYNIAHQVEDQPEKWGWYLAGVTAIARGIDRLPRSNRLWRNLAWTLFHKGESYQHEASLHDWSGVMNPLLTRFPEFGELVPVAVVSDSAHGGLQAQLQQGTFNLGEAVLVQPAAGEALLLGRVEAVEAMTLRVSLEAPAAVSAGARIVGRVSAASLSARLYRVAWGLASPEYRILMGHVRRLIPMAIARDANRLRNEGDHRRALLRYLDALVEWEEALVYSQDPASGLTRSVREAFLASYELNQGRLQSRSAWLAVELAATPTVGAATAEAIRKKDYDAARRLLAEATHWRATVADGSGIRWYDAELPP